LPNSSESYGLAFKASHRTKIHYHTIALETAQTSTKAYPVWNSEFYIPKSVYEIRHFFYNLVHIIGKKTAWIFMKTASYVFLDKKLPDKFWKSSGSGSAL